MDVKEAVGTARAYVIDLFADEQITDVGLEEVRLDDDADAWSETSIRELIEQAHQAQQITNVVRAAVLTGDM